ncbi:hypothetical protein Tco_0705023 [Tanacetum coccineum]|uniref:Tf2-1-like SH3-like domain-containing protein n=1 Tax=Tanacetum coccineum TaxID=301880 RepID=A0ABQ4Y468_9ASTR
MSDSEHSTVTYTSLSEDDLYMGSPGVEVTEQHPSPIYIPFVPEPVYPEFLPVDDEVFPAEEQPLPAADSPTHQSPGYLPESDPEEDLEEDDEEDPEEDPADYPADRGDDDDEHLAPAEPAAVAYSVDALPSAIHVTGFLRSWLPPSLRCCVGSTPGPDMRSPISTCWDELIRPSMALSLSDGGKRPDYLVAAWAQSIGACGQYDSDGNITSDYGHDPIVPNVESRAADRGKADSDFRAAESRLSDGGPAKDPAEAREPYRGGGVEKWPQEEGPQEPRGQGQSPQLPHQLLQLHTCPRPTYNTSVTSAQLQAMIDEGVNAVLAARAATRNGDDSHTSGTGARRNERTVREPTSGANAPSGRRRPRIREMVAVDGDKSKEGSNVRYDRQTFPRSISRDCLLQPTRKWTFHIDLVPGVNCSTGTLSIAPSEMTRIGGSTTRAFRSKVYKNLVHHMGQLSSIRQEERWIVTDVHRLSGAKQTNGEEPFERKTSRRLPSELDMDITNSKSLRLHSAPYSALLPEEVKILSYTAMLQKKGLGAVLMQRESCSVCSEDLETLSVWYQLLSDYDCDIRYHPGKANCVADASEQEGKETRTEPRNENRKVGTSLGWNPMPHGRSGLLVMAENLRTVISCTSHKSTYSNPSRVREMYQEGNGFVGTIEIHSMEVGDNITMDFFTKLPRSSQGKLYLKEVVTRLRDTVSIICDRDLGSEIVQETTERIIQVKQRMQAARDRQKSYADLKRKPMEFEVGDKVMLKVSPWKGVVRFGKRGKLNPRFVGPFKVIKRVGDVAYKLELPEELSRVHNTFHVSNLKKCYADEPLAVPLDGLHFDDKLQFVEEPIEITDREVKRF